jgi:hypothetical protein
MTVIEHANGVKGRAVPPLPEHTFKDSGITVQLRKIAPTTQTALALQIQREIPKPAPPVVDTDLGPEENAADPAYERLLKAWERECSIELNRRLFKLACLECEVEVSKEDVERKQGHFKAIGLEWDDDPRLSEEQNARVFYLQHIACATTDDMKEFYEAITRRSQPTEEAVQRHIETFQS